jgi:hypothetical protein
MHALLSTDAPPVTLLPSASVTPNHASGSNELQRLGEQLRFAYGPVDAPLPTRLTELVDRLARREKPQVGD